MPKQLHSVAHHGTDEHLSCVVALRRLLHSAADSNSQDQVAIDVRGGTETSVGYLGCGYWSENEGVWKTAGMALGALGVNPDTNAAVMQCATYHLSAFASREDSTTPQWNTADLFITDYRVLAKVWNAELT